MNKEALKKTLFIDVQTTSQAKSYQDLPRNWQQLWDEQVFKDDDIVKLNPAERYAARAATRPEFAKIVTLSMGALMFAESENAPKLHVKAITGTEVEILNKLSATLEKFTTVVSHGLKSFDLPLIARRYLCNQMEVPSLIDVRGMKVWDIMHKDLQEYWRFGDMAWPSLDLLCASTGVDIKQDISSDQVSELAWNNGINKIASFSSLEVVKTVKVYFKLQHPGLDFEYHIA